MADRVPRHVPRAVATQHLRVDTADDSDSATSAHPSIYGSFGRLGKVRCWPQTSSSAKGCSMGATDL